MPQIAKRKAGDTSLPANDWNAVVDSVNGGLGQSPPAFGQLYSGTVLIRNDTGEDLDRYDCISLGEPLFALQADGSVDLIFAGLKADANKPAAILTEPIAHDATNKRFGRVWLYGLCYAFVAPAAAITDLQASPNPTNNRLSPGTGNIRLLAAPSTTAETLLPVLLGVGSTSSFLIQTPPGGIPAATGTGPYTWGSATCKLVTEAGVVTATDVIVKNIVDRAIAGSVQGKADPVGGINVIDVASCGS